MPFDFLQRLARRTWLLVGGRRQALPKRGGSGGANGTAGSVVPTCCGCVGFNGNGGLYGGGGGRGATVFGLGGAGALLLVWPGATRQFPSTDVGPP
jgi:hypothetical protein